MTVEEYLTSFGQNNELSAKTKRFHIVLFIFNFYTTSLPLRRFRHCYSEVSCYPHNRSQPPVEYNLLTPSSAHCGISFFILQTEDLANHHYSEVFFSQNRRASARVILSYGANVLVPSSLTRLKYTSLIHSFFAGTAHCGIHVSLSVKSSFTSSYFEKSSFL